jgi:hypothetical protein
MSRSYDNEGRPDPGCPVCGALIHPVATSFCVKGHFDSMNFQANDLARKYDLVDNYSPHQVLRIRSVCTQQQRAMANHDNVLRSALKRLKSR